MRDLHLEAIEPGREPCETGGRRSKNRGRVFPANRPPTRLRTRLSTRSPARVSRWRVAAAVTAFSLADRGRSVGVLLAALVSFGLSSLRSGETAERALDDRSRCGGCSVSGELILEDGGVLLESCDLGPEPVAFAGQLDHSAGERNCVEVAVQGVALLALDGAVGAHPFGVVGPFAWATRTGLVSHADHFRTCVY